MNIFKAIVSIIIGAGFNSISNIQEVSQDPPKDRSKNDSSEAIKFNTEDYLLERLDVDQFQDQHGMLVATNHIT